MLSLLETQPVAKKGDAPAEEIKILGVVMQVEPCIAGVGIGLTDGLNFPPLSVQDPFQAYRDKLDAKISRQDRSEEALALRAARKAVRDADRTTWLGTNLGDKGKRKLFDDDAGVGKYIVGKKQPSSGTVTGDSFGGTQAKKMKKLGSFGDFSGW